MPIDDDDDFDPSDFLNFEDENPEDTRREMDAERKRVENLPLMKKAWEIYRLTKTITETVKEGGDYAALNEHLCGQMLGDAMILPVKIAGAEGGDLYSLRMENAVLIKIHARSLLVSTNWLRTQQLTPPEYIKLLRDAIDEFRLLFVDWVKTFDKTDDIPDDWGPLFA